MTKGRSILCFVISVMSLFLTWYVSVGFIVDPQLIQIFSILSGLILTFYFWTVGVLMWINSRSSESDDSDISL